MRIVSWNVNGIRAAERNGLLDWLGQDNPDVFCMQEVRALPDQLGDHLVRPAGYEAVWHPAQRKGYSGVATWSRAGGDTQAGIGDPRFDDEGRALFTRFNDFTLVNVYVPNGGNDLARVPYKLDFYAALQQWVDERHAAGEAVIICGDWNTAHTPIDLANPKSNEKSTGFLPEEREWIDRFMASGLRDPFRLRHPGENGHYTWWSQRFGVRAKNVGWRIDYFLVSEALLPRITHAENLPHVKGSDHCPIALELA